MGIFRYIAQGIGWEVGRQAAREGIDALKQEAEERQEKAEPSERDKAKEAREREKQKKKRDQEIEARLKALKKKAGG